MKNVGPKTKINCSQLGNSIIRPSLKYILLLDTTYLLLQGLLLKWRLSAVLFEKDFNRFINSLPNACSPHLQRNSRWSIQLIKNTCSLIPIGSFLENARIFLDIFFFLNFSPIFFQSEPKSFLEKLSFTNFSTFNWVASQWKHSIFIWNTLLPPVPRTHREPSSSGELSRLKIPAINIPQE